MEDTFESNESKISSHTITPPAAPRPPKPPVPPKTSNDTNVSDEKIKEIFVELSNNYFNSFNEDRKKQDNQQLNQIQNMLKDWTEKMSITTKTLVEDSLSTIKNQPENDNVNVAIRDAQERRSKILEDIKEAHNLQLQSLKTEIEKERREAALAQQEFEKNLRTKYDNLVIALQDKIKSEQEARMQRALEDLERSARLESERAKQSMELQQAAEVALSNKFKSIVGDLRKSWEDEELQRAKFLEERLRGHYSAVLEHMEAQLHMALQLQDDADKRWMEDVQERNKQQIETMKAFEDKCTRLYETRLKEYVSQSEEMISQYETQLLQIGNTVAVERHQFESRQRRLRLACSKWKVDYQRQLHDKYRELLDSMEGKYGSEIESLLQDISNLRRNISTSQVDSASAEHELLNQNNGRGNGQNTRKAQSMRVDLEAAWTELNTPAQERIDTLVALLDEAEVTPELVTKYNDYTEKLTARLPIMQAISRKQFLEYKLKLSNRGDGIKGSTNSINQIELMNELSDLQVYINQSVVQYENLYNESFYRHENPDTTILPNSLSKQTNSLTNTITSPINNKLTTYGGKNVIVGSNQPVTTSTSQPISSSNATTTAGSSSGSGIRGTGRSITSTIHRKMLPK